MKDEQFFTDEKKKVSYVGLENNFSYGRGDNEDLYILRSLQGTLIFLCFTVSIENGTPVLND